MKAPPAISAAVATIPALTGLRAYAAVWVMLLHLQFGIGIQGHVSLGDFVNHGGWAVDIFFVLSGFILSLLYAERFGSGFRFDTWWRFLSARFARIYPLHLFALLALALYYFSKRFLADTPPPPNFSRLDFALNLGLLHGWGFADRLSWNYPSWSIGSEWFAYLFMLPVLVPLFGRRHVAWVLGAVALGWIGLYVAIHRLDLTIGTQNVKWCIPRIAVEFSLGYGLFRVHQLWQARPSQADSLVGTALVALVALAFAPRTVEWLLAPTVAALILGLCGRGRLGQVLFASPRAVYWGERSYSIYMLHAVVQIYCNLLLERLEFDRLSPGAAWALMAAQAVVVLILSDLAYRWIEVPCRDRLRQRLESLLQSRRAP